MIIKTPSSLKSFANKFSHLLSKSQQKVLPLFLAAIILTKGKRTQAALGSLHIKKEDCRDRSAVSRLLQSKKFKTRPLCWYGFKKMVERCFRKSQKQRRKSGTEEKAKWVLLIDGTCTKRGSFTKIANAIQYKKKDPKKKGKSTKAHTFLMGLLITDTGERIPIPRLSYYTKDYSRKRGIKFRSQVDLAVMMVRRVSKMLPKEIDLIVCADNYFEGRKLFREANKRGITFIAPVDSNRCFADEETPDISNGINLYNRGKALLRKGREELVLVRGEEETASYRRHSKRKATTKETRIFNYRHEIQNVSGLGKAAIVYSWKSPKSSLHSKSKKRSYKVLVTNNLEMSPEMIIEYYELRWQVEIYFKEIKSELGPQHYQGTDFEAFEKQIDFTLLAFLFLEWNRMDALDEEIQKGKPGEAKVLRTTELKRRLEREAFTGDMEFIQKRLGSERGRRELRKILAEMISAA